jgi:hypothetical protein
MEVQGVVDGTMERRGIVLLGVSLFEFGFWRTA